MRILCLQQSSIFETYGGIEYYLHDFLTLSSQILGSNSVASIIPQRSDTFQLNPTLYEVIPVPFNRQGFLKKIENRISPSFFSAALKKGRELKPDLILVGHASLAPLGLALSKLLEVPYWTIAYGLEVWGGMNILDEWALRSSQRIVSISHWTKNILVTRGFRKDHIEVVHPCLQPGLENRPPKIYSERENTPLKLLTVSRLDPREQYKGHDHVLAAMKAIKQVTPQSVPHYTIQGQGEDKERLEKLVFYSGLQNHVTFLDKLQSREDLETLYRECDVFIMPSRFGCWDGKWRGEGFGIVYVEAGALGVPSIAYDCGGVTDIIEHGVNGLLAKPNDIEDLSRTILELHNQRDQIAKLGQKARAIALGRFSQTAIKTEIKNALASSQSISEVRPSSDAIDVVHVTESLS